MVDNKRIGLALSGGGYRAAAFHLGTLRALHNMGKLHLVDVLSTISGGSITGAAYSLTTKSYPDFEKEMIGLLSSKSVIGLVLCSWEFIRSIILILGFIGLSIFFGSINVWLTSVPVIILIIIIVIFQFSIFPVSRVIERAYDRFFYHGKSLPDLRPIPKMAIGSTNLQSARPFTFSNDRMGDSSYRYLTPPVLFNVDDFPIARAVAASSCVPFAFSPISIEKKFYEKPDLFGKVDPKLVDGGVFDNQGIHKLAEVNSEYNCDILIVSDAGNKLPFEERYNNTFILLLRTVDVFMRRIKNLQTVRSVYENKSGKQIAYLSLPWTLDQCIPGFISNLKSKTILQSVIDGNKIDPSWVAEPANYNKQLTDSLSENCDYKSVNSKNLDSDRLNKIWNISTNLTPINAQLIDDMITHSQNLTEIQVKLYCPSLFCSK